MQERQWGQYRALYGTQRWRKQALAHLATEPLCRLCSQLGRVRAATVCDHVNGHPANETEAQFWSGPFQSLCSDCHNGAKRQQERTGTLRGADADGWPIDPRHQ